MTLNSWLEIKDSVFLHSQIKQTFMSSIDFLIVIKYPEGIYPSRSIPVATFLTPALIETASTKTYLVDQNVAFITPIDLENYHERSYFVLLESHRISIRYTKRFVRSRFFRNLRSCIGYSFEISISHNLQKLICSELDFCMM